MVPKGLSRVPYVDTNCVRLFETIDHRVTQSGPASAASSAAGRSYHVIGWCFIC
jgi:hypothetical protein